MYLPTIPSNIDLYAFCVNTSTQGVDDHARDFVHLHHTYKVIKFVPECDYFPCGVRIADKYGNELTQTFYVQRFLYFEHNLN